MNLADKHNTPPVYVVTMYRWGERGNHSYVHGAFLKKEEALQAARQEMLDRGGNKYFPEVLKIHKDSVTPVLELGKEEQQNHHENKS